MNVIKINNTIPKNKQITTYFDAEGDISKYFSTNRQFHFDYNFIVENTPTSIAVIPFVCNVLPIIWLCDGKIILDELDEDFFYSIDEFKKGYIKMYPNLRFNGQIEPKKLIKNINSNSRDASVAFFSGGVDAYNTLINHFEEKPDLMLIWGADISLSDTIGWDNVLRQIESITNQFNLSLITCKTNFRTFIDEEKLEILVKESGDGYWHGFQHGIGMIGHAAPIAYSMAISKIYIASTFTNKDKVTCASDPTIDNYVKFCGCSVFHDGYEYLRQDKIRNISEFSKKNNIPLEMHVCWQSSGGKNCSACEKCYRTIIGLYAENCNPKDFGFSINKNTYKDIKEYLEYNPLIDYVANLWIDIQMVVIAKKDIFENDTNINWIIKFNFKKERTAKLAVKLKRLFIKGIFR